jgi:acyl dehydratase
LPPLTLYARATLPSLPLVGSLPGVRKAPGGLPDELERRRTGVGVDRDHLAAYARLTGNRLGDTLPGLYPHLPAFEPQLRLLADRRFPFPPLGLVHVGNVVTVHRPVTADDVLDLVCRPARLRPHRRGRLVDIDTTVTAGGQVVWQETTALLARGGGDPAAADDSPLAGAEAPVGDIGWDLPGGLGRQYAAVSGDINPIHLNALAARAFGFPRAIAHGMWTAARALALVEPRLPAAYRYRVAFRRPVPLPGRVRAGVRTADGGLVVGVVSADAGQVHLVGRVEPLLP